MAAKSELLANLMKMNSGGSVAQSTSLYQDVSKMNLTNQVQSGMVSEFITSEQIPEITFIEGFEVRQWSSVNTPEDERQEYSLRATNPVHLSSTQWMFQIRITRGTIPANAPGDTDFPGIPIGATLDLMLIDKNLIDNLVKSISIKYGQAQGERNKCEPLDGYTKLQRLINVSVDNWRTQKKRRYGEIEKITFPGGETTVTLDFQIPLSTLDSSGLQGLYKVFPQNCLIKYDITLQKEPHRMFYVVNDDGKAYPNQRAALESITYIMPVSKIVARTTRLNSALSDVDNDIINGIESEIERAGLTMGQFNKSLLHDNQYLTSVLQQANKEVLNQGNFVSLLTTPVHFYQTHEYASNTFGTNSVMPPRPGALHSQQFNIQMQMVLPKAVYFFFRAWDNDGTKFPLANMNDGLLKSYNITIDGRTVHATNHQYESEQYEATMYALGREELGCIYDEDEMPAIYGLVIGTAGNIDYETAVQIANLHLNIEYEPYKTIPQSHRSVPLTNISRIELVYVRIYGQRITCDSNSQFTFMHNTV